MRNAMFDVLASYIIWSSANTEELFMYYVYNNVCDYTIDRSRTRHWFF